jgi:tRNA/rRNA methyltransferase
MAITVILVKPEVAGNVGAIARLMGNFDVHRLVLVRPKCDHLSKEAQDRAKHNKEILAKAEVVDSIEDAGCETLIATTSKLGSDFNIPRSPLLPKQLAARIPSKTGLGVVFGPEGPGLSNEEIMKCDVTVSIPTTKRYAALNLSHAVGIILYELFEWSPDHIASHVTPASAAEKKQALKMADAVIDGIDWRAASKAETQRRLWHKLVGKSFLTKREAFALMGFLRQVQKPKAKK